MLVDCVFRDFCPKVSPIKMNDEEFRQPIQKFLKCFENIEVCHLKCESDNAPAVGIRKSSSRMKCREDRGWFNFHCCKPITYNPSLNFRTLDTVRSFLESLILI